MAQHEADLAIEPSSRIPTEAALTEDASGVIEDATEAHYIVGIDDDGELTLTASTTLANLKDVKISGSSKSIREILGMEGNSEKSLKTLLAQAKDIVVHASVNADGEYKMAMIA